jgi:hypothetical protein
MTNERGPVSEAPRSASQPNNTKRNGYDPHPLRMELQAAGGTLKSLTVLSPQHDPFRLDTDSGHRDGQWLADQISLLRLSMPRHLRGLHYVLLGRIKPNGLPYVNNEADWTWLSEGAAKASRWLGYLPFDSIIDQRNDEPEVIEWKPERPRPSIAFDFDIWLPEADDLTPKAKLGGFVGAEPYKLVLVGEKSSLKPVLSAVARDFGADLYLPTGEISDTQAYRMAVVALYDGRPLRVFYFADADPSGWQMPISLARKLQGFTTIGEGPDDWEIHRVALTPAQVREYGLPETPLKENEKRANKWYQAYGVMQTEVDALATLQPDLLTTLATEALSPFFDATLAGRVRMVRERWLAEAQSAVDDQQGVDLADMRQQALARLDEKREEIETILDDVRVDADQFDLPEIPEIPEARFDTDAQPEPLCSSLWDFAAQCDALMSSRSYAE